MSPTSECDPSKLAAKHASNGDVSVGATATHTSHSAPHARRSGAGSAMISGSENDDDGAKNTMSLG